MLSGFHKASGNSWTNCPSLDETYEQILKGISKAKEEQARRLLHCLAVAVRPLRVEELTELLAFDFEASARGPRLRADLRLVDQKEVILSIYSSLITVVQNVDSRVVQFSHFSVKEYLTSPRLAHPNRDISHFSYSVGAGTYDPSASVPRNTTTTGSRRR